MPSVETLSNDDDDGGENVAKKMNVHSFKLNRVYLDLLNMSNAGDFSWSWILKDFIQVQKEEENSSSYIHVLHKTSNQEVSRRSLGSTWTWKKCTKKRDARAELFLNLLFFEVVVVVVVVA